jgi:Flp pilus assembly protein TadG
MKSACKRSWRTWLQRLLRSERGNVTVEFVIIMPVMLMLMLGFTEVYMYMRAVSSVEHVAFTLADSIGQMPGIVNSTDTSTANSLGSIWKAATLLAAPYDLKTNGMVYVTSVCDTTTKCGPMSPSFAAMAAGTPTISWQAKSSWSGSAQASAKSTITSTSILPSTWPFRNGDSAVVVEVFMSYTPYVMTSRFWTKAPGTQTIYRRVYVRQRSAQPLALASQ